MQEPLVSVIVVSYNHANFVQKTLDGLLNQTYKNWELIVADDASKDNSVDIINDWLSINKINAKKVFHSKNTGLCAVLNECIPLTSGEYVKFIAADDIILPSFIEKGVRKFGELSQDYQLIYANAKFIDENGDLGKELLQENFNNDNDNLEKSLFMGNFIIALTVIMRREIFSLIGGFNPDFIIEDYEFWLRLSKQYKVDYINEVLGLYRWHSDNITKKIDIEEEVVRIKIFHDTKNKYSKIIFDDVVDLYKKNRVSDKLINVYKNYRGRSTVLYLFLKFKIPYKIYAFKNRLLYNTDS